jgi:hypothetical protein
MFKTYVIKEYCGKLSCQDCIQFNGSLGAFLAFPCILQPPPYNGHIKAKPRELTSTKLKLIFFVQLPTRTMMNYKVSIYREEHLSATGFHHGHRHVLLLLLRQHCRWRLNLQLRRLLHHSDVFRGRSHALVVGLAEDRRDQGVREVVCPRRARILSGHRSTVVELILEMREDS